MSNMYGYTDYHGPDTTANDQARKVVESDDEEEDNPLQAGFWMEGDSLAPPCGTAVPTIHRMLEFAEVNSNDVLYDLGCGDARVCLEAYAEYTCQTIGVECEDDLIERAQHLISSLAQPNDENVRLPRVIHKDLRELLDQLLEQATQSLEESTPADAELPLPTIIVLYLLPESLADLNDKFKALLQLLPPPFRIMCNTWGLPGLKATTEIEISEENGATSPMHLYTRHSLPEKDA